MSEHPSPSILIVDDEAANRYVLSRHLRAAGFAVREAATGTDALIQLEVLPDLVILDVNLPDLDGREICRIIKSSPRTRHVMVLHASAAFATAEDRAEGLEGGADGYLTYPLNLSELVANVRALLRIRQAEMQARQAARHLEITFSAINDGVCLVDASGRILRCNPAMSGFLGMDAGLAVGELYYQLVELAFGRITLPAFRPSEPQRARRSLELKVGERWFLMVADPVLGDNSEPSGAVHVLTDITERKRLDAELRRRSQDLARANRAKDEFLAMLGHELRNPLAPILNAVTVMRSGGLTETALERAVEIVERQVHHMARLVDDLLDVSRINRGTIELRRRTLDINQLLLNAAQNARPQMLAQEHDFQVELPEGPLWVHADSTRLEQVFANLLTNAVKYTQPGGKVKLTCRERDGEVRVKIQDNGRGIPAAMLAHVFDLFTQVSPNLDRSLGGLGLGLTLVRRLVEMHGGSVSAHSEGEDRGAEFVVLLPIAKPPLASEEAGPEVPNLDGKVRKRVLIVEDNPDSRDTLCDLIQLWGHEVEVAGDGVSGLSILAGFQPDIALIDIGLPGIDGYELARQFRSTEGCDRVRLVALTGYGQPEDRRRALQAGFDEHLVKPLDPEKLRRLLTET